MLYSQFPLILHLLAIQLQQTRSLPPICKPRQFGCQKGHKKAWRSTERSAIVGRGVKMSSSQKSVRKLLSGWGKKPIWVILLLNRIPPTNCACKNQQCNWIIFGLRNRRLENHLNCSIGTESLQLASSWGKRHSSNKSFVNNFS